MSDWNEFSQKWNDRLNREGIEFFRAVDAASFRGPFEHWRDLPEREKLRRALFSDLMKLIKQHVYRKFACTIVNKEFQSTNSQMREQFVESAYNLAARTCEKYARHWVIQEWKSSPEIEVAFVFEAGDPGQRKLQEQLLKDPGRIPPTFCPKKDTRRADGGIKPGFVPLQAADWLAWELNRAARDSAARLISESELRWPMQQFLGGPDGKLGIYTPENLKTLDNMIAVENSIISWEATIDLKKKGKNG